MLPQSGDAWLELDGSSGGVCRETKETEKKEPISPVVVLCTLDVFAKVKEKLTTRKMSSEVLTSALLFLFLISHLWLCTLYATFFTRT